LDKIYIQKKKPEFLVTDSFEFKKISKSPDYAIAQSLFTHLTLKDIKKCLRKLRAIAKPGCKFYATFDEEQVTPKSKKKQGLPNPSRSHSNLTFYYSAGDIESCAKKTNWNYKYIGDFGHPSKQQMVLFWI
jgi:hypothetical protein